MSCEKTCELMHLLPDGELSATEEAMVRQHLESCESCRTEYDHLKELLARLENLPAPAPPKRLRVAVEARLDRDSGPRRLPSLMRLAMPLAAGLIVAVGWWLSSGEPANQQPTPASRVAEWKQDLGPSEELAAEATKVSAQHSGSAQERFETPEGERALEEELARAPAVAGGKELDALDAAQASRPNAPVATAPPVESPSDDGLEVGEALRKSTTGRLRRAKEAQADGRSTETPVLEAESVREDQVDFDRPADPRAAELGRRLSKDLLRQQEADAPARNREARGGFAKKLEEDRPAPALGAEARAEPESESGSESESESGSGSVSDLSSELPLETRSAVASPRVTAPRCFVIRGADRAAALTLIRRLPGSMLDLGTAGSLGSKRVETDEAEASGKVQAWLGSLDDPQVRNLQRILLEQGIRLVETSYPRLVTALSGREAKDRSAGQLSQTGDDEKKGKESGRRAVLIGFPAARAR